jgi:hypothetical protein
LTVEPFLTTRKTPLGFSILDGKRGGVDGVCRYINIKGEIAVVRRRFRSIRFFRRVVGARQDFLISV